MNFSRHQPQKHKDIKEYSREFSDQEFDYGKKRGKNSRIIHLDDIEYSKIALANCLNEKQNDPKQTEYENRKFRKNSNEKRQKLTLDQTYGFNVSKMKQLMIEKAPQFRHQIKTMSDHQIRNMYYSFNNHHQKGHKWGKTYKERPKPFIRETNERNGSSNSMFMESGFQTSRRPDQRGRSQSYQKNQYIVPNNNLNSDGFTNIEINDKNQYPFPNYGRNQIQQKWPQQQFQNNFNLNQSSSKTLQQYKNSKSNQPTKTIQEQSKKQNKPIKKKIRCKLTLYLSQSDIQQNNEQAAANTQTYQNETKQKIMKLQKMIKSLHQTFQNGTWKINNQ